MRVVLWLAAAVLLGVAAVAVYMAFQRPDFVAGLVALAVGSLAKAVAPIVTTPLSKGDTAAKNAAERRGQGDNWIRRRLGSLRER